VNVDHVAQRALDTAVVDLRDCGVLEPMRALVGDVWKTNCTRYEPKLGDDSLSLGIQSSRNICNRAAHILRGLPGVVARGGKTLEIHRLGRVMHIGKVPSESRSWSIDSISWDDSDVRHRGAEANSSAYVTLAGTLFEGMGSFPGQPTDPAALGHLHMSWQGFADGTTRVWVGFPCLEAQRRWFAVSLLDGPGDDGGRRNDGDQPTPPEPDHDQMAEPTLPPMTRRDGQRQAPGA
jgi:hypothetical protein